MAQNTGRRRRSSYTTSSGKSIKINRSLSDQREAKKAEKAAAKALYLSTLPKDRWKRMLYRLRPDHLYHYWFSKQGALMAIKLVGFFIAASFLLTIGLFAYYRKDLPQIKDISGDSLGGSVSYYDSTGKVLLFQDYNGVKRVPVSSNQISPYVKEATIAIEDKNFYKEGAFDIRGIMRAGYHDIVGGGGSLQGGSTITQQLVKLNEGWTDDRTITRKIKELILAVDVERAFTKDQILTAYLNIAPYGGVDYGVQAASEDYFREPASSLTLPQAAMLAAIPQAPSYYSPYGSTKFNPAAGNTFSQSALIARQRYILQLMATQHYITEAQAKAAMDVNILAQVQPELGKYNNIQDPYFVLAAKQQLENQFGASFVNKGGLKVITTLNTQLQNYAEQDVANNIRNVADAGGDEQAMVAENVHTGQVVALVGGEDFNNPIDGQINYANIRLSPGSSMKPFLYAALINNNTDAGAGSVLYDTQQPLPGYPCTDKTQPTLTSNGGNCLWDDTYTYPGPVTIRYALAGSRNVPAVKASMEVDPTDTDADLFTKSENDWINMADEATGYSKAYACYQQGVDVATAPTSDQTQCYGSAAIGGGDISIDQEVNGDVTFANMGAEIPQTFILKITDADGQTDYQWKQPTPKQVYKPDTAYIINNILSDPKATYLPVGQKFQNINGWDVAVKTGTENQEYNGIMTAWSTQYAVAAFAGYHTLNVQMHPGLFEAITEPISRTWMEQALDTLNTKPVNWTQPAGIKSIAGYVQQPYSNYGQEFPGPTDDLYPSWYVGKSGTSQVVTVDKVSGLIATSCTPTLARSTIGGGSTSGFSIDIFYPKAVPDMAALEGGATTSKEVINQTDDVHSCSDTQPSVSVSETNTSNNASGVCDGSCSITVTATAGTHPLSGGTYTTAPAGTITVSLGGNNIQTISIPPDQSQNYTTSFTYTPTSGGSGNLTATVVDSVLYSTSNSVSISYGPALSGFSGSGPPSAVVFDWSGGIGPYTVMFGSTPVTGCTAIPEGTDTCNAKGPLTKGTYTLDDSENQQVQYSYQGS